MLEYLTRVLALLRRAVGGSFALVARVVGWMQAVEIDRPRGVLLCIALQVLVVAGLAFFLPVEARAPLPTGPTELQQPADGSIDSTQPAGGVVDTAVQRAVP